MLAIQLECGGTTTGEITMPFSAKGKKTVTWIKEMGMTQGMQVTIRSSRSSLLALPYYINGMEYGMQVQKELEFLALRLEHLTREEQVILSMALKSEGPEDLKEIINLSYNLDLYGPLSDTGRNHAIEEGLLAGGKGMEVYKEYLPDPGYEKDALFLLHLYRMWAGKTLYYSIALPAVDEKLDMARQALQIDDFSECSFSQYGAPKDELRHHIPVGSGVEELNQFAKSLKRQLLVKGEGVLSDLMAVLEAECPRNMEEASRILENLDQYDVYQGMETEEEHIGYMMEREGPISTPTSGASYPDGESLGEALMKRDGAILTRHGVVACKAWCCERLPEDIVVTRLFSPLAGVIYYMEEEVTSLSACGMAGYEDEIRIGLERNEIHEMESGLAEYLDNFLLKKRIISMFPTVEKYRNDLWGILEVKSHGELLTKEWETIRNEWSGQMSDGWGEVFEQENLDTMDPSSEMVITILSSLAQEESRNISTNVHWGIVRRYEKGEVRLNTKRFLGYTKNQDNDIVIEVEEAIAVRRIFRYSLEGKGSEWIKRKMEQDGFETGAGREKWWPSVVERITDNEKYMGDALLQKTYTEDYLTKKRTRNVGQLQQFYVSDCLEPIIPKKIYYAVQEGKAARRAFTEQKKSKSRTRTSGKHQAKYALADIMVCGECGHYFRRVIWTNRQGQKVPVWRCSSRLENGTQFCHKSPTISERDIQGSIMKAIRTLLPEEKGQDEILKERMLDNVAIFYEAYTYEQLERILVGLSARLKYYEGVDASDLAPNQEWVQKKMVIIQEEIRSIEGAYEKIKLYHKVCRDNLLQEVEQAVASHCIEYNEAMVRRLINKIEIRSKDKYDMTLKSGQVMEISM